MTEEKLQDLRERLGEVGEHITDLGQKLDDLIADGVVNSAPPALDPPEEHLQRQRAVLLHAV